MPIAHFKYRFLLVLCGFLVPLVNIAQRLPIQEVKFQHEDFTLPGTEVLSAFQDRDGFLWLYVEGAGIVRYDGQEMEVSKLGQDFEFHIAELNMLQDRNGYLWVICDEKGAFVSDEPVTPLTIVDSLTFSDVSFGGFAHNWQSDKDGNIWTNSPIGLLRCKRDTDNDKLAIDTFSFKKAILEGRKRTYIKSFLCTSNEGIWISTDQEYSQKVVFSKAGRYEIVDSVDMMVQVEDAKSVIWGYKNGEIFYKNLLFYRSLGDTLVRKFGDLWSTSKIQLLNDEHLLVIYQGGKLDICSPSLDTKRYATYLGHGIPDNPYDLLVGKQNTWISHEKGLALLPNTFPAFTTYQFPNYRNYNLLEGLLHLPTKIPTSDDRPNQLIPHFIAYGSRQLSFYTKDFHLLGDFFMDEPPMPFKNDSLHLDAPSAWMSLDLEGNIVGYNYDYYEIDIRGAFREIARRPEVLTTERDLFHFIISDFYHITNEDTVQKKMQHTHSPNWQQEFPLTWKDKTYDSSNSPTLRYGDKIWMTVEDGVFVFDSIQSTPIGFIPIENTPCGIVGTQSKIWVGSSKGIWKIDPFSFQVEKQINQDDGFTYDRGVGDCLSLDADSVIYFLTHQPTRGRGHSMASTIERYDPKWDAPQVEQLPIHLKKATYQENNWGNNELNIKYVGLSYRDPFSLRYRTRLKGYEKDWSAATKEQSIRFTNLSALFFPKTYQFEVMAKDHRDIWYEMETPYVFQVKPALPLRWWAFLLYITTLFLGFRWYLSNKLKQQIRTQKIQEAAIIKIQRDEIAQKNAQNELLLKEIHHRVKNNLETVSSLLELQSAQVEDDEVQSVMQASQNRVQSMSILHQKLYQGKNLASIEMKDYFKNLSESILDTYDAWEKISIEYNMDEIKLDIDTAIPLGLIANELITNSLKYAFLEKQEGTIELNLKKIDKKIKFSVKDNGIGLQENLSFPVSGFGSQLIQLLVSQIDGKMEIKNQDGLMTEIQFPLTNIKSS